MRSRTEDPHTKISFTLGSHLDLFWMGTHEECLERGDRIIEKAMDLCEEKAEYCFYIETTVFAEHFLRRNPEKRQALISLVEGGRIEIGASYVDRIEQCHGGESLVRHAVYGVRWIKENFGITPLSAAHPDLPGMSPQVPQIYSKAGVHFYLRARGCGTIYEWQAPDGSSIVYANLYGDYAAKDREKLSQLLGSFDKSTGVVMMRGGYGDLVMPDDSIINLIRWARKKWPEFDFSISSPSSLLRTLRKDGLPAIRGEFPFGWSSATTVHAQLFRLSTELENMLLNTERFTRIAELSGFRLKNVEIPYHEIDRWSRTGMLSGNIWGDEIPDGREIEETWKFELFTQDHNYQGHHGAQSEFDKVKLKEHALRYAGVILEKALNHIVSQIPARGNGVRFVVFNPLSWKRTDVIELPPDERPPALTDGEGNSMPVQIHDGRGFLTVKCVPAIGYTAYYPVGSDLDGSQTTKIWADERCCSMQNDNFTVRVNACSGDVVSIYDRHLGVELVAMDAGMGFGELISYKDPGVDVRYAFSGDRTRGSDSRFRITEFCSGSAFALCALEGEFLDCKVRKEFILYTKIGWMDVKITLFWWGKRGEHVRLCFPFSDCGFQGTRYGVPFHSVVWPQMMEGMDDQSILTIGDQKDGELSAKDRYHFREVVKWLAVGYGDRVVTLSTPSSSYYIDGSTIQAVLLRTQYSCRDANLWSLNQGKHEWAFRIFSDPGDWRTAKSYQRGWEHHNPMRVCASRMVASGKTDLSTNQSFCGVSTPNVIVTALKKADREDGTIVRLVEMEGRNTESHLQFFAPVKEAHEVDLLERNEKKLQCRGGTVRLNMGAHEIKTLLLI